MNGIWTLGGPTTPTCSPGTTRTRAHLSTVDVLGEITGLDIQRSVVIDLRGFRGARRRDGRGRGQRPPSASASRVPSSPDPASGGPTGGKKVEWIEPGLQALDGRRALSVRPVARRERRLQPDAPAALRRRRAAAEQADPVSMFAALPRRSPRPCATTSGSAPARASCRPGSSSSCGSRRAARSRSLPVDEQGLCGRRSRTSRGSAPSSRRA